MPKKDVCNNFDSVAKWQLYKCFVIRCTQRRLRAKSCNTKQGFIPQCGSFRILLTLKSYVKSTFGEFVKLTRFYSTLDLVNNDFT